jgi:flagellar basal-body rod protein FlgF
MDRLAFNAVAAINEQRISRQMTVNDLANVSTVGFKRSYEAATRSIKVEGDGLQSRYQPQSVATDKIDLSPGAIMATGRKLDVALNGQSVMGVTTPAGELAFTRRGDLQLTAQGVLQMANGTPIRGESGGPITVPPGFEINITADGSVFAQDPAQAGNAPAALIDRIVLREASQVAMERRTDGLFKVLGQVAGTDIAANGVIASLTPRALEGSNVNAITVMVKMMEQSRSFEHQVRIIKESKTGDESGATMLKLS